MNLVRTNLSSRGDLPDSLIDMSESAHGSRGRKDTYERTESTAHQYPGGLDTGALEERQTEAEYATGGCVHFPGDDQQAIALLPIERPTER